MKGFGIYVQNDLLEAKHYQNIGNSLWLYLWLLDKITSISEEGTGKVLGGSPVKFEKIIKDLPLSNKTYTRYIEILVKNGYIAALRTPYGYVFTVSKAKKIFGNQKEKCKVGVSLKRERYVQLAPEICIVGVNKEDNTVDNTNTTSESDDSRGLAIKEKDMSWGTKSDDYEEGAVDFDGDGKIKTSAKPQTKKYPNAPTIRKIFQEVLGRNPANWKTNKNQLTACENLYTERTPEKVRIALQYFKENEESEFCPKINSPYCLDTKWTNLGDFKIKNS